jgi:hypothetical protein
LQDPGEFDLTKSLTNNNLLNKNGEFDPNKVSKYFIEQAIKHDQGQKEEVDLLDIPEDPNDKDYYKKIKLPQADWIGLGYQYDINDPRDLKRRERGLPPKSVLAMCGNTPEGQERLRNGKLPAKLENTQKLIAEANNFYNEALDLYKNNPIGMVANSKTALEKINGLYSNYKLLQEFDNQLAQGNATGMPQQVIDEINKNKLSGKYDIGALEKAGFTPGKGFSGLGGEARKAYIKEAVTRFDKYRKVEIAQVDAEPIINRIGQYTEKADSPGALELVKTNKATLEAAGYDINDLEKSIRDKAEAVRIKGSDPNKSLE